jgi:hypothetical protein
VLEVIIYLKGLISLPLYDAKLNVANQFKMIILKNHAEMMWRGGGGCCHEPSVTMAGAKKARAAAQIGWAKQK